MKIDKIPLPPLESWRFIEELKQPERRTFFWNRTAPKSNEADLSGGVRIVRNCPDPKHLLDTAYDDLNAFLAEAGLPGNKNYPVITEQDESGPYDSFRLVITKEECRIIARDTEGIRRGIFHLEDLLLASDGPFLKTGEIRRDAWIKNRISRCFFGPIKRPPMNRDELLDDVNYYPDAYLNRLAHEGVNGLWLTVEFKDLCRTRYTPDAAPDAEKRLAKLQRTVEQCLRYGIKTYLFTIEPVAWTSPEDPVLKRCPELGGAIHQSGAVCFCPSSETAQDYLYKSTRSIFRHVPELAGIINISLGERTTTCLSSLICYDVPSGKQTEVKCPRCGGIPHHEILYRSVDAMTRGMRSVNPEAEFISWLYIPSAEPLLDWVFTLSSKLPEGATLLYNFESGGVEKQLGKDRVGGDYWLSYVGPSDNFRKIAANLAGGAKLGAKLQVGCSHEIATAPYLPVPAQLYRKYREMHRLGITSVMQCWYFGNYPGLMNKAAGMLAFEEFRTDEKEFLERLARPEWDGAAKELAEIWALASEAYRNYPLSNTMQYYGPYHDGVVWPLYPTHQYLSLAPTWLLNYPTSGDLIGECLENHTLAEAEQLAGMLASQWHKATEKLLALRDAFQDNPERRKDIAVMEALDLQFTSAWHIFRFYLLREEKKGFTDEMRAIMEQEIRISERMAELCEADSRLGFHSEAENYKFFPEKLRVRAEILREMMTSPPPPLPKETDSVCGDGWHTSATYQWKLDAEDKGLKITVKMNGSYRVDQIFVTLLGTCDQTSLMLDLNRNGNYYPSRCGAIQKITENADGWTAEFLVPWKMLSLDNGQFRISFVRYCINSEHQTTFDDMPKIKDPISFRLILGFANPKDMLNIQVK